MTSYDAVAELMKRFSCLPESDVVVTTTTTITFLSIQLSLWKSLLSLRWSPFRVMTTASLRACARAPRFRPKRSGLELGEGGGARGVANEQARFPNRVGHMTSTLSGIDGGPFKDGDCYERCRMNQIRCDAKVCCKQEHDKRKPDNNLALRVAMTRVDSL